jgi:hypothetical protein
VTPATVWLSCGVLRAELETLHQQRLITGERCYLDSMLHMAPPLLEQTLRSTLQQHPQHCCLVLVYGDCCSRMLDLVRDYRVGRVDAINCAQLLVGRERYRQLMREGAFMVLPEWALRWQEIMQTELGLSRSVARDLMQENRSVLVYLDTGLTPVPELQMAAFAEYTGLQWRVERVALDHLLALLLAAEQDARRLSGGNGVRS